MTEWFKKLCNIPINYGLKHINYLISNGIQIFLNTYGDKLFSLKDVTIEKNECNGTENLFYLSPVTLKESTQYIGLNLVNVRSGMLNGIVITTPAISQETNLHTKITVNNIDLNIEMIDASQNMLSTTLTAESFDGENSINDVFASIKNIILRYLHAVCCKIQSINIKILNGITIAMSNIYFDHNKFVCGEVNIFKRMLIAKLDNIRFESDKFNTLSIDFVRFDTELAEALPELYFEINSDKKIPDLHIDINKIVFNITPTNRIEITNIGVNVTEDTIVLLKLRSIMLDSNAIYHDTSDGNVAIFEKNSRTCTIKKYLTVTVPCTKYLNLVIDHIKIFSDSLTSKIIFTDDECNKHLNICNLNLIIVQDPRIIEVIINKINHTSLSGVQVKCENNLLTCDEILCSYEKYECHNVLFINLKKEFSVHAKKINIANMYDIIFTEATANNLSAAITAIANLVASNDTAAASTLKINLQIKDSKIIYQCVTSQVNLFVHNGAVNITDKVISNADVDVILDAHLLSNISINKLTQTENVIDTVKVFVNPDVFDKINVLLGTLSDAADKEEEKITQIMSQTSSAHSGFEFESCVRQVLGENSTKSLFESFSNLRYAIINDYGNKKLDNIWNVLVSSVQIYLFNTKKENPFLSIIAKNIQVMAYQKNVDDMSYEISVQTVTVVDMLCTNPKNKYFLKNTYEDDVTLAIILDMSGGIDNVVKVQVELHPLTFNVNEETMLMLLSFFSNSYQNPQKTELLCINFCMKGIILTVNYYPSASKYINNDILSMQDCKLLLSSQKIMNVNSVGELFSTISQNFKKEINLLNLTHFIPNVKAVQPITSPVMYIYKIVEKYFSNGHNKKKLRGIINDISSGTTFVQIQKRIYQLLGIFNGKNKVES